METLGCLAIVFAAFWGLGKLIMPGEKSRPTAPPESDVLQTIAARYRNQPKDDPIKTPPKSQRERELEEEIEKLKKQRRQLINISLSPWMLTRQINAWKEQNKQKYNFSTEPLDIDKRGPGRGRDGEFKTWLGRSYEFSIARELVERGYKVADASGEFGKKDLGRDLIARSPDGNEHWVIQCKYRSSPSHQISQGEVLYTLATAVIYALKKMGQPVDGKPYSEGQNDDAVDYLKKARVKPVIFSTAKLQPAWWRTIADMGVNYIQTNENGRNWEEVDGVAERIAA